MALSDFLRSILGKDDPEEERKRATQKIFDEREFDPTTKATSAPQSRFDNVNLFKHLAEGKLKTGVEALDYIPRTGSQFIQNRVIQPLVDVPETARNTITNTKEIFASGRSGMDRLKSAGSAALSGVQTVGAFVPGIDDAAVALAYDTPKAVLAGKSKMSAFTGEEYTPLGESLVGEGKAADVLNAAELPLILAAGSAVSKRAAAKQLTANDSIVKETFKQYQAIKPEFDTKLNAIATKTGTKVELPGLKKLERTLEKTNADYGGDITKVRDIARAQFIPDSPEQARVLMKEIEANFPVTRAKDRFANPGPDGYRDFMINIDVGGGKQAEIQIQIPEMLAAKKGEGHAIYKKYRTLEAASNARKLTPEETAQLKQFELEMKGIYDAAWEKANQRLGSTAAPESFNMALNSSADISLPLRNTDSTGNLRGGLESNANTSVPLSSSLMDTGTPSTSKNLSVTDPIIPEIPQKPRVSVESLDDTPSSFTPIQEVLSQKRFAQEGELAPSRLNSSVLGKTDEAPPAPRVKIEEDGKLRSQQKPEFEAAIKYYDTVDDVKQTIEDLANKGYDDVQKARRGTITFKETRKLADALGMGFEDVENRKIGKLWNAEQVDAATRIYIGVTEELNKVGTEVRTLRESGAEIPRELEIKQMDLAAQAQAMTASILGDNAEAGRALNVRKLLKQATETGDVKAQQAAYKLFAGDEKKAKEVIKKLSEFAPDDNLGRTKFLRHVKPSTIMEKIEEYWYNSVLSNTATHIVNSTSNLVSTLITIPEKVVAGTIDSTLEKVANTFDVGKTTTTTKTQNYTGAQASILDGVVDTEKPMFTETMERAYKRDRYAAEAAAEVAGITQGTKNGFRRAWHVIKNGISEAQASKLDIGKNQAIKGRLGNAVNIPSRALVAEDEFFKSISYEMDLNAQAARKAKQEGLKGAEYHARLAELVNDPTPQMISSALDQAKYKAFQSDSKVAGQLSRLRDLVSVNIPGIGKFKPLQFVIPFIQTPINVLKWGLERSPVGLATTTFKAATGVGKGDVLDSASRAIVGSMAMIPLAAYFTEGKIIGAAPSDPKEKDAFYADGKIPWSVKIGDEWIAYNRVEPLNTILRQIAQWHDASKQGKVTTTEQIGNFLRSEARNMADQTFMTGVGNLMDAVEDPERYGEKFITDITGGFVPSLIAAGARASDNTVRKPETVGQSFAARLPMLSRDVPAMPSTAEPSGEAQRRTNDGTLRNFLSNFVGMRSSRDQGTGYQENVQRAQAANKETRAESDQVQQVSNELLTAIKNPDKEAARQVINDALSQGRVTEEVLETLQDDMKAQAKTGGDNQEMKLLRGYSQETKARYVVDKLKSMENEDRAAWLTEMTEAGIVTDNTMQAISELLQQGNTLPLIDR